MQVSQLAAQLLRELVQDTIDLAHHATNGPAQGKTGQGGGQVVKQDGIQAQAIWIKGKARGVRMNLQCRKPIKF